MINLDGINYSGHFVSLFVQCLVHGRCFLVGVNLRIMDLHILYPLPHVHPHTKLVTRLTQTGSVFQLICSENREQKIFGE